MDFRRTLSAGFPTPFGGNRTERFTGRKGPVDNRGGKGGSMLRTKMAVVTAGAALLFAAATGAYAQVQGSSDGRLSAVGRAMGAHAGSATVRSASAPPVRLGPRLAKSSPTSSAPLTRSANGGESEQGESEQECATLAKSGDNQREGQDDQGENEQDGAALARERDDNEECATLSKPPAEKDGTLSKRERDNSDHESSDGQDRGDDEGGSGGGD
jgi:hypothetical protein